MSELNQRLLDLCTEHYCGLEPIESCLQAGASPMAAVHNSFDELDNLYGAVVDFYCFDERYSRLFDITKLFCKYGLDLSKPEIPFDDANIINPVWNFTVIMNDNVLPILRYLLDYGLDKESAHTCWYHAVENWRFVDGSLQSAESRKQVIGDLKKIMLIASFPRILDRDEFLQKIVWASANKTDITRFRNWEDYSIAIDDSRCTPYPNMIKAVFTFFENVTKREIWKIGFEIKPEEI